MDPKICSIYLTTMMGKIDFQTKFSTHQRVYDLTVIVEARDQVKYRTKEEKLV